MAPRALGCSLFSKVFLRDIAPTRCRDQSYWLPYSILCVLYVVPQMQPSSLQESDTESRSGASRLLRDPHVLSVCFVPSWVVFQSFKSLLSRFVVQSSYLFAHQIELGNEGRWWRMGRTVSSVFSNSLTQRSQDSRVLMAAVSPHRHACEMLAVMYL
jgi:hypothetical protein